MGWVEDGEREGAKERVDAKGCCGAAGPDRRASWHMVRRAGRRFGAKHEERSAGARAIFLPEYLRARSSIIWEVSPISVLRCIRSRLLCTERAPERSTAIRFDEFEKFRAAKQRWRHG